MAESLALLRHSLAVVAYRATRALENAPAEFVSYDGAGRTPAQILAHVGDLYDWALSLVQGHQSWRDSTPLVWPDEVRRFYSTLQAFDAYLASGAELAAPAERLLQGPIADSLTHIGQIAMLRRMAGCATAGENFFVADIRTGSLGPEQPAPRRTF